MKEEEFFVCPNCRSGDWSVLPVLLDKSITPLNRTFSPVREKRCKSCGYVGEFIVAKKGDFSKEDLAMLKDIQKVKRD